MKGMGSDAVSHGYAMTEAESVIGKTDVSYRDRHQWREWVGMSGVMDWMSDCRCDCNG